MDIGSHCSVCGRLDFLPFDCHRCGQIFCGDHRLHDCPEATKSPSPEPRKNKDVRVSAAAKASAKPDTTTTKPQAAKPSASTSKSQGQKLGGSVKPAKNERAMAALSRLKQMVGISGTTSNNSKPQAKPSRLAKKPVSKIIPEARRSAIGNTQIPLADRVYFHIERVEHEWVDQLTNKKELRLAKTACMFFTSETTAGQILDRATTQLAVPKAQLENTAKQPIDLSVHASDLPEHLLLIPKH